MEPNESPELALGSAIRMHRRRRGLSQEELAFECGLHRTYIGSIERGLRNICLRNILAIAHALGLSGAELLASAEL